MFFCGGVDCIKRCPPPPPLSHSAAFTVEGFGFRVEGWEFLFEGLRLRSGPPSASLFPRRRLYG
jgi:hypothetical protein